MSNYQTNFKVTCDFLGRLGNNLFQTAAIVGYAEKHGVDWAVPAGYHHKNIYIQFPKVASKATFNRPRWHKYEEINCQYNEIPFIPEGQILRGFFQTELYFKHCRDKILDLFNFQYSPLDYVSIHVRRGDYLEYPANFPTITETYLKPAMKHFEGKKFLVFSDDIQWCKDTFATTYPGVYFEFCDYGNEYEQLSLMSSCEHNIIANSSFSWWGAWANKNTDKIVISPSKETWFGPNSQQNETTHLIPEGWIQIHTR
jgi:hypothetical protein